MTAYVTLADGSIWRLPVLLAWEYERTDGCRCDWAKVEFLPETRRKKELCMAKFLRLERSGKTVFFGVVDELRVTLDLQGHRAELVARGLMALLTDSQLRQKTCAVFGPQDAAKLAKDAGVERVQAKGGTLQNFSWGTGASVWSVIDGYCRHAGTKPRFLADGTLALSSAGGTWDLTDNCPVEAAEFRLLRCAAAAEAETVSTGGQTEKAESSAAKKLGITARKVASHRGKTLPASWRSAAQRLEDADREAVTAEVVLPGVCPAEPGDTVVLSLPQLLGGQGRFHLRSLCVKMTEQGTQSLLELEGGLGSVAG